MGQDDEASRVHCSARETEETRCELHSCRPVLHPHRSGHVVTERAERVVDNDVELPTDDCIVVLRR